MERILPDRPISLTEPEVAELSRAMEEFDATFLRQRWAQASGILQRAAHLRTTFDHQFRCTLHAIYTADHEALDAVVRPLHAARGNQLVFHIYSGYGKLRQIPNRASWDHSS